MAWKTRWDIKQFLTDENVDDEAAHAIGLRIADYLERMDVAGWLRDEEFMLDSLREAETQADVNYALQDVYDWADAARVWLGA